MLAKAVYRVGIFFHNRRVFNHYNMLKRQERLSNEELKNLQLERARDLIGFSYCHSPYMRNKFDSVGFKPDDLKDLSDLKKIPKTRKKELIESNRTIHANYDFKEKLFYSETSGSTGEALRFYRTLDWDAAARAAMFRGFSWHDVKPWEKNGYFWGYNLSDSYKIRLMDFLQNRFRIFSYDPDSIEIFCRKLKQARYLEGYSSMIFETAKIINQKGRDKNFDFKMVKGTSEKIFDYYQAESVKAFGKKIINEYGSAETGLIAFECPYGNMHVAMENVIVEEEDNEIVVTNLWSHSFPIIRYNLGDYIKLVDKRVCGCGLKHDIIEEVYGRTGELIRGNKLNYPSLAIYYIWKNLALRHNLIICGQGIQKVKGELILNITSTLNAREKELVYLEAEKYFSDDIVCIIEDGREPVRSKGKLRDFISEIH